MFFLYEGESYNEVLTKVFSQIIFKGYNEKCKKEFQFLSAQNDSLDRLTLKFAGDYDKDLNEFKKQNRDAILNALLKFSLPDEEIWFDKEKRNKNVKS